MLTPGLNQLSGKDRRLHAFVRPPVMAIAPARAGPVGGPSWCICMLFARSFRCFLSRWRKVVLPLALWQEFGPNFKGLPKVSGVATYHWVFLRCDWSPISSWFITNPRLRKKGVFPNLMWMEKNFLILRSRSLVKCGEGVRHPTTPIQWQSFILIKP